MKNDKIISPNQKNFIESEKSTIRAVAQLLRNMAAAFEAVPFGWLYYQLTEKDRLKH